MRAKCDECNDAGTIRAAVDLDAVTGDVITETIPCPYCKPTRKEA